MPLSDLTILQRLLNLPTGDVDQKRQLIDALGKLTAEDLATTEARPAIRAMQYLAQRHNVTNDALAQAVAPNLTHHVSVPGWLDVPIPATAPPPLPQAIAPVLINSPATTASPHPTAAPATTPASAVVSTAQTSNNKVFTAKNLKIAGIVAASLGTVAVLISLLHRHNKESERG